MEDQATIDGDDIWLRKSLILQYDKCPQKAKYQFIDGREIEQNEAMRVGTMIHDAYEEYFQEVDYEELFAADQPYHYIREQLPEHEQFDFIAKFEASRLRELENPWNYVPRLVEWKMKDEENKFWGTPDRVDVLEPGIYTLDSGKQIEIEEKSLCVVELKTGNWKSYKKSDLNFQLVFYKNMIENNMPFEIDYISAIYPKDEKIYFNKIWPQTERAVEKKIEKVRNGIREQDFEAKPSILCNWCDMFLECLDDNPEVWD